MSMEGTACCVHASGGGALQSLKRAKTMARFR